MFCSVSMGSASVASVLPTAIRFVSFHCKCSRGNVMDLGIPGWAPTVCASSQGLGKGCAQALAEAGVTLVINGRNQSLLEQTAQEIRDAWKVSVTPVIADVSTPEGQKALLQACPAPDILVNNNAGPPLRNFRELDRK